MKAIPYAAIVAVLLNVRLHADDSLDHDFNFPPTAPAAQPAPAAARLHATAPAALAATPGSRVHVGDRIEITMADGAAYSGEVRKESAAASSVGITLYDRAAYWHFLPFASMKPNDQTVFGYHPAMLSPDVLATQASLAAAIQGKLASMNAQLAKIDADAKSRQIESKSALKGTFTAMQVVAQGTLGHFKFDLMSDQEPSLVLIANYRAGEAQEKTEMWVVPAGVYEYTTQLGFQEKVSSYKAVAAPDLSHHTTETGLVLPGPDQRSPGRGW